MKRIFFLSLVLLSCTVDQHKLSGTWQAVAYFEAGQSVNTPLEAVRLSFADNGGYIFHSIGFYEEAGQYRVAGKYLFLRDTTEPNAAERAVKVQFLSKDSLKIGMEADGKRRVVFFGKLQ